MTPRKLTILLALGLLLAAARGVRADEARDLAKQHFAAGETKFKAADYRGAIAEFEAADALVPSPILSYNIGLCYEKLGDDETAVARYRDYLNRRPDAPNKPQVEGRIHKLEDQIAAAKAPPPKVEPQPAPVDPKEPTLGPGSKGGWVDPDPKQPTRDVGADPNDTVGDDDPSAMGTPVAAGVDPALAKRVPKRMARAEINPDTAAAGGGEVAAGGPAEPAPAPGEPEQPHQKKAKPVYKEWWFWVVVGVSAVIVVSMFDNGSSQTNNQPGGLVLFNF